MQLNDLQFLKHVFKITSQFPVTKFRLNAQNFAMRANKQKSHKENILCATKITCDKKNLF